MDIEERATRLAQELDAAATLNEMAEQSHYCNKCGWFGGQPEHEGCNYAAAQTKPTAPERIWIKHPTVANGRKYYFEHCPFDKDFPPIEYIRAQVVEQLVEALEGLKHMILRDGSPCFCKNGYGQGSGDFNYYFEPSGEMVHGLKCAAARAALSAYRDTKGE